MIQIFQQIEKAIEEIDHGWTSPIQARQIAQAIIQLRPALSVEIGVYAGKGIVTMGLAHKFIGIGKVIGIDPYSPIASSENQVEAVHKNWWASLDHERIYNMCVTNIDKYGLNNIVTLIRQRSDDVEPPKGIGFIRIDGDHNKTAIHDVKRFCPNVIVGGVLHLDDINWKDGAREHGSDAFLKRTGWIETGRTDTGAIYAKTR